MGLLHPHLGGAGLAVSAGVGLDSRRIVHWSLPDSMAAQLLADASMVAAWRRGAPLALLHHSAQGSQTTIEYIQQLLKDQGITWLMSRAGVVRATTAKASLFSELKTERTVTKAYQTGKQIPADGLTTPNAFATLPLGIQHWVV